MSGARAFRVWVRVLDKRRRLSAASESTAVTVTVEDAPESDGQLTVTESTVPVNRFVVTPLTVARNRIGAPTTRAVGGVVVEMSRVRVITEGCTSANSSARPR